MWKTGTIALALLVLIVSWGRLAELSHIAYENITFRFEPTAERAFQYGERHFNAKDPQMYDIDRAERYFDQAAAKDPSIPYLYHELARISFLRGDFDRALARINFHIRLHLDTAPSAYYARGLINGFKGDYTAAEKDFEHFLKTNPDSWAGINDYAWVLLKNDKPREAAEALKRGVEASPENPWLLNSYATALYELEGYDEALVFAQRASVAATSLTEAQWSRANPGNDPRVAGEGVATFRRAVEENIHTIELAIASSTVESR